MRRRLVVSTIAIVLVVYGRAFCSWGCFFGGQDELFASMRKKRRWKLTLEKLHPVIRYFPFALLAFVVLHSFATISAPTGPFFVTPRR